MLGFSTIAIIFLIVGGKRLYPAAGRWAVLVMGIFFMVMARVGNFAGGEQWMALGIGCVALLIGVNLLSPLFAASLANAIGWPIRLIFAGNRQALHRKRGSLAPPHHHHRRRDNDRIGTGYDYRRCFAIVAGHLEKHFERHIESRLVLMHRQLRHRRCRRSEPGFQSRVCLRA